MKYFLEMIALAKQQKEIHVFQLDNFHTTTNLTHFFDTVKKAKVFVFSSKNDEPVLLSEIFDEHGQPIINKLDAPFSTFSIEILNGLLTVPMPSDDELSVITYCILAYEVGPSRFCYYAYLDRDGIKIIAQTNMFDSLVKEFVDRINTERQGQEKVDKLTVLLDKNNRKYDYRIKNIIHISPKKNITSINPNTGKHIEWRYRVIARGHWRDLLGKLGKDRDGIYQVAGKTWVSESKPKGPSHLPIRDKIRFC